MLSGSGGSNSLRVERNLDDNSGSGAWLAAQLDVTAVRVDDLAHEVQSQPETAPLV
jgi:hypothetical protein